MTAAIPAEWAPHRAMWVGWPTHGEYWFDHLDQARDEVEGLVRALAGPGREQVKLMVGAQAALEDARARFAGVENVEVEQKRAINGTRPPQSFGQSHVVVVAQIASEPDKYGIEH